ncbi:LytR/AlgR family response regulator transcription factor [Flavilitoribacter nigricans]|uniref:DNA-binding response regulator n=1 Tax=Flavilitoribacter nigricans (strain ATCC 23147 / DSM 23189 / NBRC 102662 / NCIMB 1420 / SS-2) TaxID=1122177 RepID=A0A2D0N0Y5_FLAN2|nr:response regulator [Flavilitoribacter nigricans]PHN02191.1 hypothetical protein CRP01_33185 [Flavilitoribacter nigricans DSM 23189 = NBRC 102662]
MKPITAIIIDDETKGIDTLEYMLSDCRPTVDIIGKYSSSIEGLKAIKKLKPDLLFLDIKMPHINGIELLELAGATDFNAIFVTAFDEFKLQALRLNALDYLIKPFSQEDLQQAVTRVETYGRRRILEEQVLNAVELLRSLEIGSLTRIGIKSGNKVVFINLFDLSHCKSDGNFTYVYLADKTRIHSNYSLGNLEEILPDKYFFRMHREYIVNGKCITAYDKSDGGIIVMHDGTELPIARARKDDFLLFLRQFINIDRF